MVSALISFIAGAAVTFISGNGHITNYVAAITTSFATMQVVYRMYFEGSVTDVLLTKLNS